MKIITSKIHGILDYLTVIFFALSPTIFNIEGHLKTYIYILAVVHLLLTITTRYELGIVKLVPFKLHGIVEFIVAMALTAAALWLNHKENLFGFHYFIWLALIFLVVFLLTDFNSAKGTDKI